MPAYFDSEKGTWYASFHYKDYTGANKRKLKRGFAKKRDAQEYERNFKEHGHKDPTITYAAFVEEYIKDCKSRLKPTTILYKEAYQKNHIIPYFGKVRLCDITPLMVRTWQNKLMSDGTHEETTLRRMHSELSSALNYAIKYYNLQNNVCRITGPMGKTFAHEMTIWTQEDFERFIVHEKKPSCRVAFLTLYWTGMRVSELLALTPEDIDHDKMVIHVTKGYAIIEGKEMFLTPKNPSSNRDIDIHSELYGEILKHIDDMMIGKKERIFPFYREYLLRELHRTAKIAGLDQIRLHDLRHSHASWLIHKGIPITAISKRLGHNSPSTTLRVYSHLMPGDERNVADKIEKSITKSSDIQ